MKEKSSPVYLRKPLHQRVKSVSALAGEKIQNWIEKAVNEALKKSDAPAQLELGANRGTPQPPALKASPLQFAERAELPPKSFMLQKQPHTDIERIACLTYYLTHYRDTQQFKTLDISKLNIEAAQSKFSNTAFAVVNAVNAGLLVSAEKGFKQLSAIGELYVEALPDRDKAKEVWKMINGHFC